MFNIALDLMGGDFAPVQVVNGVKIFLDKEGLSKVHFYLLGEEELCRPYLSELPDGSYTFHPSGKSIGMKEHPVRAFKEKPDSSINLGFLLLKENKVQALISAGNTGAMLVGASYYVEQIPGVSRPVIPAPIPCYESSGSIYGTNLLLDAGLNADCKAENLNHFALLGSVYAQLMYGKQNPKIGLLNIGEEEGKGNLLVQKAYQLLKENQQINFVGNVEGRDVCLDKANVIVCDGYTGNIVLKAFESFYTLSEKISINHPFLKRFDYAVYGGIPVLGINKTVIIGHGISNGEAFENMIRTAIKTLEVDLVGNIIDRFAKILPVDNIE